MLKDVRRGLVSEVMLYILVGIATILTIESFAAYIIIAAALITFCSYYYFRNVKGTWQEGLKLGIFFIILSTLFDLVFISITAVTNPESLTSFWELYANPMFFIGVLEILVIPILIGHATNNKK